MYFRKVLILNLFVSLIMSQEQLGSDIDGEVAGDNSGGSVSLDSDGDRVAIGAYNNDGTDDLPVTLSVSGTENSGDVRYPALGTVEQDRYGFAGNPYYQNIERKKENIQLLKKKNECEVNYLKSIR